MPNIIELSLFDTSIFDIYTRLNENQLFHYFEPNLGIFIAESPNVIHTALKAGYTPLSFLMEKRHIEGKGKAILDLFPDTPVYTACDDILQQIKGFSLTRGMLCAMYRKPDRTLEDVCANAKRIAVLENVVNPTNIGAIFRSAAALNMDAVLLTGGCCDPLYRRAVRVSMGTVFQIPWTYICKDTTDWLENGVKQLHQLGFKTAAMALTDNSVSIDHPELMAEEKLAIILGTEGDGLASSTIADCDYTVKIPMAHGVDSLNVAAASAVAFWQLGNR